MPDYEAMMDERNKQVILDHLDPADIWGQLAEEAAELAQAALKMQRLLTGRNPPRLGEVKATAMVVEEHADLALCFELLSWNDKAKREKIRREKLRRWADSLQEEG